MKNFSIIILVAGLMILTGYSFGQDTFQEEDLMIAPAEPAAGAMNNTYLNRGLISFEYNISFPIGDFKDNYISNIGSRGGHFELKGVINDHIAVGGSIGWYGFYEKYPRQTYEFESGAVTTTVFNYYYSLPLKAVAHYYFMPSSFIQPFAGISLGATYNELRREIGIYYIEDTAWDFMLTPEVGVLVPFGTGSDWGAVVKGRYNHVFFKNDNINGIQTFDLTIGLVYAY